jgi:hypothetical protein
MGPSNNYCANPHKEVSMALPSRRSSKDNYEWPGMMNWSDWKKTRVHAHAYYA